MNLLELFQQPSAATWELSDDSDQKLRHYLIKLPTGQEYVLTARGFAFGLWLVSFALKMGDKETTAITKTGNAPTVFSVMADCVRDLVKTMHPKSIAFTGNQDSRNKLYGILAKKMATELGWNINTESEKGSTGYLISEPKKKGFFSRFRSH